MKRRFSTGCAKRRIPRIEARRKDAAVLALALSAALAPAGAQAGVTLTTVAQSRSLTIQGDGLRALTEPATDEIWIGQTYITSSLAAGLTSSLSLVLTGGVGFSGLDEAVGGTDLTGPTDMRAKLFYRFAGDRILLGAGVVVPTGRDAFETDEITTAQWTWNPLCGFPLKRLGEGLGGDVSLAAALPVSEHAVLGFGAGYYSRGEYDLLSAQESRYSPGAEMSATAGIDFPGDRRSLRIAATFRGYEDDKLNDALYISQGDQLEFGATFITGGERVSGTLDARAIAKAENKRYRRSAGPPTAVSGGTSIFLSGRLGWSASSRILLFGDASWSKFGDFGIDQTTINGSGITVGPGIAWRPSRAVEASVRAGYAFGGTDSNFIDFSGYDIMTSLVVRR